MIADCVTEGIVYDDGWCGIVEIEGFGYLGCFVRGLSCFFWVFGVIGVECRVMSCER